MLSTMTRRAGALAATVLMSAGLAVGLAAPASASTPTVQDAYNDAVQIFYLMNRERSAAHLAGYTWNNQIVVATQVHNSWMYRTNLLSHQCPGEPSLGSRISATGYHWRAVGENIGVTTDWSQSGLMNLATMLYNDASHRALILSSTYRNAAVHVLMDAGRHNAWLTFDFGVPL